MNTAVIDFDGVLATVPKVWKPGDHPIGKPILENIRKVNNLWNAGYVIFVHTARHWEEYWDIRTWLFRNQVPFHAVICGKVLADIYVDDRAVNSNEEVWCL